MTRHFFTVLLSLLVPCVTTVAFAADDQKSATTGEIVNDLAETKQPQSSKGRKERLAYGRLEKKVESYFRRMKLAKRNGRRSAEDYYVVAKFHMPMKTRAAEVRFAVTQGIDKSSTEMNEYLASAPEQTARQFKILYRLKTAEEAEKGVEHTRKQYDDYKQYQARIMRYLKQAASMRRC